MPILIGIDEAGLGPNLGPYVVTATVWETPDSSDECDLWRAFAKVATSSPSTDDRRLHIGDSKAVFQPGRGLAALERGVLAAAGLLHDGRNLTDRCLRRLLAPDDGELPADHWYAGDHVKLPVETCGKDLRRMTARWAKILERTGIRLRAIHSTLLEPTRFNALIDVHQNKAHALSLVSLNLLKRATAAAEGQQIVACCDKHGGRNYYDQMLSECFDDAFVFRVCESAELSVYRLGSLEVRFQPRAEVHFPVALASMVSKYVRELAMLRFNRFWMSQVPDLKPTQGYPVDARRFREAIASQQQSLRIPDSQLWRCR